MLPGSTGRFSKTINSCIKLRTTRQLPIFNLFSTVIEKSSLFHVPLTSSTSAPIVLLVVVVLRILYWAQYVRACRTRPYTMHGWFCLPCGIADDKASCLLLFLPLRIGVHYISSKCQFCSKPANWMHTFTMVVGATDWNTLGQKARGGQQRSLSRTESFSRA